MKVKRFEAPDTKSALALVKEELGPEAVILSTRTLPPEPGCRPLVEVVAAVDFDVETVGRLSSESNLPRNGQAAGGVAEPRLAAPRRGAWRPPAVNERVREQVRPNPAGAEDEPVVGVNLSREARLLQQRFAGCNQASRAALDPGGRQSANALSVSPPLQRGMTYPGSPPRAAAAVTDPKPHSDRSWRDPGRRPSPEEVTNWRNQILEQLAVQPLQLNGRTEPLIIALVGPTGVGKTTTAAKIAAWFSLHENARVALLSMDCYRIGATDQLRTYARIMRLPCEIALRQQDLDAALHKHRQKDLIIIDTAGKSPFDDDHIPELSRWFTPHGGIIPYLVLSATAKKEDLNRIIAAYRPLGVPAAILTKLDETRAYAALCQQLTRAELPIACLCTGQKVPEDFLPASRDFLKTLFGGGWDAAMRQQATTTAQDGWLAR